MRAIAIIAGVLVLAATALGVVLKLQSDHRASVEAGQVAQAKRLAAAEAAEQQKQADKAKASKDSADKVARAERALLIKAMQKSITKDARKSVSDGVLDGPILYTQCTPLGGGSADDLTAITGTFSCLAANKENNDGTISGYSYSATASWKEQSYTWHLGN